VKGNVNKIDVLGYFGVQVQIRYHQRQLSVT